MVDADNSKCGSKYPIKMQMMCYFLILFCLNCSSSKEEEVEEYFRKKYADEATVTRHFGDGGEDMTDEITQQTLLPGVK